MIDDLEESPFATGFSDFTSDGTDPIYGAENRWPDKGSGFRDTMRTYLDACARLSLTLLEAFCVGLKLPADFMRHDFAGKHTGFVRLNYYPVADPLAASSVEKLPQADMGVHHHTDAGALTVLLQDDVGGLQVCGDEALAVPDTTGRCLLPSTFTTQRFDSVLSVIMSLDCLS